MRLEGNVKANSRLKQHDLDPQTTRRISDLHWKGLRAFAANLYHSYRYDNLSKADISIISLLNMTDFTPDAARAASKQILNVDTSSYKRLQTLK